MAIAKVESFLSRRKADSHLEQSQGRVERSASADEEKSSRFRRFITSKWTIGTGLVAVVAALTLGLVTAFCPPVGLAALAMGLASLYAGAGAAAMGLAIATFSTAAAAAVLLVGGLMKGVSEAYKAIKLRQESSADDGMQLTAPGAAVAPSSAGKVLATLTGPSAAPGAGAGAGPRPPAAPEHHSGPLAAAATPRRHSEEEHQEPQVLRGVGVGAGGVQ